MVTILAVLVLMAVPVLAQPELPDPGITPDSPFYFMDRLFDVFQSAESRADERASEMVAMAQTANAKGLEKAKAGYEKAMGKRQQEAEEDENVAEEVARQSSNHLSVLARVREQVPEQAKAGIDRALNESAKGRENALAALERQNPNRAGAVAEATLQEVIANAPEAAQAGLQRAMEAVQRRGPSAEDEVDEEEDAEEQEAEAREDAEEREAEAREEAGEAGAPTEEETEAREEGAEAEQEAGEQAGEAGASTTDVPSGTPGGKS